jgi:Spy/CpxP family protein refolding chaperone
VAVRNTPAPRVWLATFVALVFTIGLFTGVVVERTWLHSAFTGDRNEPSKAEGPSGQGEPGRGGAGRGSEGRGPAGRGAEGRGLGRGGPMFGPPPQQYVEDLSKEVHLTDAQQAEVLELLQAQETRLRAMQEDTRATFIREQEAVHDKIAAVLTPEQAAAFRAWVTTRTGRRGGGPPR